ncbi:energy transducer TonB [Helicobacter sp.]|uniref:energy transducer TonB n=1 Tax=Helicobacter sp. TaxID=218 RepID=UPI0025BF1FCF|nr:energy transducer TonB [Helicobacter sp.]MCI5969400.1 energy transducer TonB [Helicobacter sp.]MDY2585655.1 energy transducer TonB [Helicobacter sp.]
MRNNLVALFLSLLIHCILFLLFFLRFEAKLENVYNPPPMGSEQGERVSLKHFRFQQGSNAPQNMESKNTNDSKASAESESSIESLASLEFKKNVESKMQETKIQEVSKEILKESFKEVPQQMQKASIDKPPTPQTKDSKLLKQSKASQESKASEVSHFSALEKSPSSPSIYDFGTSEQTQQIQDLYGAEFGTLSPKEQEFIKNHLDAIGKITQRYLKYPAIAGRVGQEGDNVVEFYLHPNGDITDLKLLHASGYRLLDDNSLRTIRIAYKDYPYPSEKTKIRIRVMYRIY